MGIMALSYILGLLYLVRKRTLGKVAIIVFVGIIIIANGLGFCINHFTGWREIQKQYSMNLSGFAVNLYNEHKEVAKLGGSAICRENIL